MAETIRQLTPATSVASTDILPLEQTSGLRSVTIAQLTTTIVAAVPQSASGTGTSVTFGTALPVVDGTATAGVATSVSRSDHVHPSDTSKASVSALASYAPLASPALTGTPTAPTAAAGTNNTQIATMAALATALAGVSSSGGTSVAAGTTTPVMDGTATVGTLTAYARADHVHPSDTSKATTGALTSLAGTVSSNTTTISALGTQVGLSLSGLTLSSGTLTATRTGGTSPISIVLPTSSSGTSTSGTTSSGGLSTYDSNAALCFFIGQLPNAYVLSGNQALVVAQSAGYYQDTNGNYNFTTGVYTAPIVGNYRVTSRVSVLDSGSTGAPAVGTSMGVGCDVSLTAGRINWGVQNPSRTCITDNRILRVGAGQTIYVTWYSDSATATKDTTSEITIEWVGP